MLVSNKYDGLSEVVDEAVSFATPHSDWSHTDGIPCSGGSSNGGIWQLVMGEMIGDN